MAVNPIRNRIRTQRQFELRSAAARLATVQHSIHCRPIRGPARSWLAAEKARRISDVARIFLMQGSRTTPLPSGFMSGHNRLIATKTCHNRQWERKGCCSLDEPWGRSLSDAIAVIIRGIGSKGN
ncbi:hypothetical protein KC363_g3 [Hortaea werneckii]|nr:hypothetical protein KC363_g3 [Hortaea werneckii]